MKELTAEVVQIICGYIRTGIDFEQAAVAFGFSIEEAKKLLKKIESPKTKIDREIRNDIIKAVAQFEIMQLQRIIQEGGASGAKWILERRLPGKYNIKRLEGEEEGIETPFLIEESDFTIE